MPVIKNHHEIPTMVCLVEQHMRGKSRQTCPIWSDGKLREGTTVYSKVCCVEACKHVSFHTLPDRAQACALTYGGPMGRQVSPARIRTSTACLLTLAACLALAIPAVVRGLLHFSQYLLLKKGKPGLRTPARNLRHLKDGLRTYSGTHGEFVRRF